jgi:voltage-gated potassium channel
MLKLLLLLFVLVSACVAIHGMGMILGLRWLARTRPVHHHHFSLPTMFWILVRVVYGLLVLHLLQILVWAACYHWAGCFPDFTTSFYYSATSYSTVGFGDVIPPENWRILGSVEAVTGILMFGWSTGVLFTVVNHLHARFAEIHQAGR